MTNYILTYFEVGDKGELVQHRETFITGIAAHINYALCFKNKRRTNITLWKEHEIKQH